MKIREVSPNPRRRQLRMSSFRCTPSARTSSAGTRSRPSHPQARCWARPPSRLTAATSPTATTSARSWSATPATPGSPDYVDPVLGDFLSTISAGGAVCWENIDCVSWGSFTGAASLPSPPGTPAAAIPTGSALVALDRAQLPDAARGRRRHQQQRRRLLDRVAVAAQQLGDPDRDRVHGTETVPTPASPRARRRRPRRRRRSSSSARRRPARHSSAASTASRSRPAARRSRSRSRRASTASRSAPCSPAFSDPSPAKQNWKVKKPK